MEIKLLDKVGNFAENKDTAKEIRVSQIIPNLRKNEEVILDFEGVESATQSFIHALISDIIREFGVIILNDLKFKNCNETIKKIINIVCEYMQTEY
ncbi:MAG: STAS-like domain-containing protein [Nanoarchaeota archaeon]